MAHKVLVGGTAYDILGGKTMVAGTNYNISKGRTLVGGTGYDISFNQTWEKWDVATTYNCYETDSGENAYIAIPKLYGVSASGVYHLYYSAERPSLNSSGSGNIWDGMTEVFESKPENYPYTAPSKGYFCVYNGWGSHILAKIFLVESGTVFSVDENDASYVYCDRANIIKQITPHKEEIYSKGSTLIETVTAPADTYPANGKSGDYWYVLKS